MINSVVLQSGRKWQLHLFSSATVSIYRSDSHFNSKQVFHLVAFESLQFVCFFSVVAIAFGAGGGDAIFVLNLSCKPFCSFAGFFSFCCCWCRTFYLVHFVFYIVCRLSRSIFDIAVVSESVVVCAMHRNCMRCNDSCSPLHCKICYATQIYCVC